ncbi:uncharacterized protein LOC21412184 isoform X2 [Morus notabilis]|uniref:uncharacterized protein LOC21412184 isoform X2 n=1 Tax=Morus notabilis TaxID=981085 RepID=UPI000CED4219|nr:uncharacterized protein LOC21412184 isoform X2 [Morus notabilis]
MSSRSSSQLSLFSGFVRSDLLRLHSPVSLSGCRKDKKSSFLTHRNPQRNHGRRYDIFFWRRLFVGLGFLPTVFSPSQWLRDGLNMKVEICTVDERGELLYQQVDKLHSGSLD